MRNLAGRLMMTDDHTRAAAAFLYGIKAIPCYSFEFWEAADIRTDEKFRRKGFGTAMTAYLTNRIVSAGKTATCRTRPENVPMRCTIEKCGYERLYE